jgi:nitrate reductase beta subunit
VAEVYNWQLGREQPYPYEREMGGRQFVAVFNINRCIGCQTCSMACKSTWTQSPGQELMWWNNVETKPYGGYPANWDINTLKLLGGDGEPGAWNTPSAPEANSPYGTYDGPTIFEAGEASPRPVGYLPTEDDWKAPNTYEDHATRFPKEGTQLPEHEGWFFYLQRICNHCSYPGCLAACPRKAIYKRPEDGIVLVDQARCRGYRKCVEACPYKKTMYRPTTGTTEKCVGCYPRVDGSDPLTDNLPTETRCVAACVGKIRLQGLAQTEADGTWTEDPKNPFYYLVHEAKVALPLYPQFGTQPNVFYIPPRWVPRPYLHQMFGPGVDQAIDNYAKPSRELLAVLQLFRVTQRIMFSFDIEKGDAFEEIVVGGERMTLYDDTAIGRDEDGNEIVRVKVSEPIYERPEKLNSI